jgi:hypothetical protein
MLVDPQSRPKKCRSFPVRAVKPHPDKHCSDVTVIVQHSRAGTVFFQKGQSVSAYQTAIADIFFAYTTMKI